MQVYSINEQELLKNINKHPIRIKYNVSNTTNTIYITNLGDKWLCITVYDKNSTDDNFIRTHTVQHRILDSGLVRLYVIIDSHLYVLGDFEKVTEPKYIEDVVDKRVIHSSGIIGRVTCLLEDYHLITDGKAQPISIEDIIDVVETECYPPYKHSNGNIFFYIAGILIVLFLIVYNVK